MRLDNVGVNSLYLSEDQNKYTRVALEYYNGTAIAVPLFYCRLTSEFG